MLDDTERLLSIFCWFGYAAPLPERFQLIKQAGFDATSLWWAERSFREMGKGEMVQAVQDAGLRVDNMHVPFINCNLLWSADVGLRDAALKDHMIWLEDCCRYTIPSMVMHVTEGEGVGSVNAQGMASINALVRKAEELGVRIAIENVRQPEFIEFLLTEYASEHLGFCYDSSHDRLYSDTPITLLQQFPKRLIATHFSDTDGKEDVHWLPGTGAVDWVGVSAAFPGDYAGYIALEVGTTGHEGKQSPQAYLAQAYQKAQWVRGLLR